MNTNPESVPSPEQPRKAIVSIDSELVERLSLQCDIINGLDVPEEILIDAFGTTEISVEVLANNSIRVYINAITKDLRENPES